MRWKLFVVGMSQTVLASVFIVLILYGYSVAEAYARVEEPFLILVGGSLVVFTEWIVGAVRGGEPHDDTLDPPVPPKEPDPDEEERQAD